MHPLETCLATLRQIYDTGGGVAETSYYGALENLLNQAGDSLNPKGAFQILQRSLILLLQIYLFDL
jgi:hypothetical protein